MATYCKKDDSTWPLQCLWSFCLIVSTLLPIMKDINVLQWTISREQLSGSAVQLYPVVVQELAASSACGIQAEATTAILNSSAWRAQ